MRISFALATLLVLSGCPEESNRCDSVNCGDNAACVPATGVCECVAGYDDEGGNGCVDARRVPCTDLAPANGTSLVANVDITWTEGTGWSTPAACNFECDPGYAPVGAECLNAQSVPCSDAAPANATSTPGDVEITYTPAGGWSEPAACAWSCDSGYGQVGDECLDSQLVACADEAPANAASIVVDVEITYTEGTGWSAPAACDWECVTDYALVDGACVNSQTVPCADTPPAHATSVAGNVTITYTTAGGWTAPAACAFTCDLNYGAVAGECLNSQTVPCADAAPANATSYVVGVTITYTTAGGWTTPAACSWTCDTNYAQVAGACINSQTVACADAAPANATSTPGNVTVTYTTAGGWTAPAACAWSCNTNYAAVGGACVNTQLVSCVDAAPANATSNVVPVTITYTTAGGWTTPATCAWSCNSDYAAVGGACVNSQTVACTDAAPANATSTPGNVTISYTSAGGWTTPAACAWTCNTDYAAVGGACVNSQTVACADAAPANATSTAGTVTITYTTAAGWTTPAACAWTCNTDYALIGGACVNSQTVACDDTGAPPANASWVAGTVTITYTTASGWTAPAACAFACDTDYAPVGGACVNSQTVACTDAAPANATSTAGTVTITYTTAAGWTTPAACAWTCNTDYALVGGACINQQSVPCDASGAPPANATITPGNVTITYTTAGGWTAPAACAWACNTDYALVGGACVNQQTVTCVDVAPANASSTVVPATITYTTAGGWTTPPNCAWSCNTDYDEVGGSCINAQMVSCIDVAPVNATSTVVPVAITYTTAAGWTTPASCSWSCNTDYALVGGACINQQTVSCVDAAPANATSTAGTVTITYTTASGWSTPASCAWTCNTDYAEFGGACINQQTVPCNDVAPANATSTVVDVTITYTTASGWTMPADCSWACNTDYDLVGGACINQQTVACDDSGTPPANSTWVPGTVTITYTSAAGWAAPAACAFVCDTDFAPVGGACVNSQMVPCTNVAPANATSTVVDVEITYTTASGWTTPDECIWACNTDYDLVGGACVNSQSVPCDSSGTPPANSTWVAGNVTITYTTAVGWTAPAACDFACDTGFHEEAGACPADVTIGWCNVQWPTTLTAVAWKDTTPIYGQVYVAGLTEPVGRGAGIDAMLCFGPEPLTFTELSELTCITADYNVAGPVGNNDEYAADVVFPEAGAFEYIYAFSGDGGVNWAVCNVEGLPGTATVSGGLMINEVDYDQPSTDGAEFVEIYNSGTDPISLTGKKLVLVNGNDGLTYATVDLATAGTELAPGQYLVVGATSLTVPGGALKIGIGATNLIQNGSPDGIALVDTIAGTLLDALSYEGSMTSVTIAGIATPVSLVEGTALVASDTGVGALSLSRSPDGRDGDDANADWTLLAPTPGAANVP